VEPIPILSDFVIVAPESALKGKRTTDKEKHVRHFFQLVESFVHTSHRTHDKNKFICAHFCLESDVAAALEMDTTPVKFSQNEEHPNPKFVKWTDLKPPKTQEQIDESKRNTIQVIDIPLQRKGLDVRNSFKRFGDIVKLTMVTKGLYQQAYITYANQDASNYFTNVRAPDESSQLGPSHESSRVESSRVGKFRTRDLARVRRDLTR